MRSRPTSLTCHTTTTACVIVSVRLATRPASALALRFTPAPLSAVEIGALVALGWLREGTEVNREHVGEAVAAAIRDMASRLRG